MSKIAIKCRAKKFNAGYLLLPATASDKRNLDVFCDEVRDRYVTVTANYAKSNKTYDQCKTVFALTAILFQCNYDRLPSSTENERMYRELLEEYAPREPNLLHPEKDSPVPLSRMDKRQAGEFINSLIALIMENCDLSDKQQIDVKQIFEEFHENCGYGEENPMDYDSNGNMLSEEEWRKRNNFSFASGIKGTEEYPLHLHHIITKKAREDLRNATFNWIMLTPEEHRFFHDKGWEEFLGLYPSCAKRVKNAFDKGKQMYSLDLQNALKKLGLIDEMLNTVEEEPDLAAQALQITNPF